MYFDYAFSCSPSHYFGILPCTIFCILIYVPSLYPYFYVFLFILISCYVFLVFLVLPRLSLVSIFPVLYSNVFFLSSYHLPPFSIPSLSPPPSFLPKTYLHHQTRPPQHPLPSTPHPWTRISSLMACISGPDVPLIPVDPRPGPCTENTSCPPNESYRNQR